MARSDFNSRIFLILVTIAVLGFTNRASAQATDPVQEGMLLVKASDCFQCHRIPAKLIGPAFKDIANKYKGADDAKVAELANKVIQGGAGVWGTTPMRAHPTLSVDDAKKMVLWVLSLGDAGATTAGSLSSFRTDGTHATTASPTQTVQAATKAPQKTADAGEQKSFSMQTLLLLSLVMGLAVLFIKRMRG